MPYTKEMLEAQVAHWQKEAERQRKARIAEGLVGLVVLALLISFTLWYTRYTVVESDKRWCTLMVSLDDRWQRIPNPSEDAKRFADQVHDLRRQLHCEPSLPTPVPSAGTGPASGTVSAKP